MKFLVIGCGSIGRRHAKNLQSLGYEVFVSDITPDNRKWAEENLGIKTFEKTEDALKNKLDAVLICTPSNTHISIAIMALEADTHVFIEKPISNSLDGIEKLAQIAEKRNRVVMCACNLRFSSALQEIKKLIDNGAIGKIIFARLQYGNYLPKLRKYDYRKSYAANKKMGGGIILDDTHEIDYIHWLLGDVVEVTCVADKISDLDMDVEDFSEIILKFKNGTMAEIHSDYLQRNWQRTCELIGEKGTILWYDQFSKIILARENEDWKEIPIVQAGHENEMYIRELEHFIYCIKNKQKPIVGVAEAKKILDIALAAKQSAMDKKTVKMGD